MLNLFTKILKKSSKKFVHLKKRRNFAIPIHKKRSFLDRIGEMGEWLKPTVC
jgi:hypothetical protein